MARCTAGDANGRPLCGGGGQAFEEGSRVEAYVLLWVTATGGGQG